MNLIHRLAIIGALAACIPAGALLAQDDNANNPPPPENDGDGRHNRGNFDPTQFHQRLLENIRTKLAFTNDEEWASVQPLVQKVMEARRDTMAEGFRMGGRFGGGEGRPFARGDDRGGEGRPSTRGDDRGGPGFRQSAEAETLQKALDGKGSSQEVKTALTSYRAARKDKESKLAAAQENLRKVLSVRQEAQAVLLGLLP